MFEILYGLVNFNRKYLNKTKCLYRKYTLTYAK